MSPKMQRHAIRREMARNEHTALGNWFNVQQLTERYEDIGNRLEANSIFMIMIKRKTKCLCSRLHDNH